MTNGPFRTDREALISAGVYSESGEYIGIRSEAARLETLRQVLAGAGVELGEYDERIARWLCGWDDQTVTAITSWIKRAGDGAGRTTA